MPPSKPIPVGEMFGRMTILRCAGRDSNGIKMAACLCICGNEKTVRMADLRSGKIVGCGCVAREALIKRNTKHEKCGSITFICWIKMRERCLDKNCKEYPAYGGRGIGIHLPWIDSFETFLRDVGERPSLLHSLDRFPDQNGNYEPGNIRWATNKEQARNRRTNRLLKLGDMVLCVSEWAERMEVSPQTLFNRLNLGWSDEKTLTTPVRKLNFMVKR